MDVKERYSDEELAEFKVLIQEKLDKANKEYAELRAALRNGDNSDRDTAPTFKNMEDGAETLNREELGLQASRLEKFIKGLQGALVRIENKTYGICRVTGKLIPKERLRAVPHATLSVEAKEKRR
ncbi:MAG: TraR/DksA family transcriptional regulator [Bacteroidales bacterium]|nr:TraR/DksA family transcriptional regulator [Bacteroidales bacterium]MBP5679642.1 TraR/DksA family transcriptional regulator [Bacteroidales bacterium]MBQ7238584.1 TraR/DksA family transcriptional regulator [Bacteroidales bacterium]